jgi:hypothetical protein
MTTILHLKIVRETEIGLFFWFLLFKFKREFIEV